MKIAEFLFLNMCLSIISVPIFTYIIDNKKISGYQIISIIFCLLGGTFILNSSLNFNRYYFIAILCGIIDGFILVLSELLRLTS